MSSNTFPINAPAVIVSATTSGSGANRQAIPSGVFTTVRVYNAGPDAASVASGPSTVAATTSMLKLPAGVVESFSIPSGHTHVDAICASSTASVQFCFGDGE